MFLRLRTMLVIAPLLTICCCGESSNKNPKSCNLYGELNHTQYWNKYDSWDLSSLYVIIKYTDGSEERVNGSSSQLVCSFNYISPVGMKPGSYDLTILDSQFIVSNNTTVSLGPKELGQVNIIDYPYSGTPQELFDSGAYAYIIIGFIAVLITISATIYFVKKRKDNK